MTDSEQLIVENYKKQLVELENEYVNAKENRQPIKGSQAEVFHQVGQNLLAEKEYNDKKMFLENAIADIVGISDGVAAFIDKSKKQLEYSKLDVDAGTVKVDNSLNPFEGKTLNI